MLHFLRLPSSNIFSVFSPSRAENPLPRYTGFVFVWYKESPPMSEVLDWISREMRGTCLM